MAGPPDFRSSRSCVFRPRECHLIKLDVTIRPQKNQQLARGVLRTFGRRLGHVTGATCVQRNRSLELTKKSMGCGSMEGMEGIRNPLKLLKRWSGRPDSNRRRPAWEIDCRLQTENLASTASTDGDRITPGFNHLLQCSRKWSKNGAKTSRNN